MEYLKTLVCATECCHSHRMSFRMKGLAVSLIVLGVIAGTVAILVGMGRSAPEALRYESAQYGFTVNLPDSWKGYTVITDTWKGSPTGSEVIIQTGPLISIRHPLWSEAAPRQDIPVMIFTNEQWNAMQSGEFHIGAAPLNPSELARNETYVFALPARYNYAFPLGYEEVDALIEARALRAY